MDRYEKSAADGDRTRWYDIWVYFAVTCLLGRCPSLLDSSGNSETSRTIFSSLRRATRTASHAGGSRVLKLTGILAGDSGGSAAHDVARHLATAISRRSDGTIWPVENIFVKSEGCF